MITTVCLNPSIDKTCEVKAFEFGGTNRISSAILDAGGKGINVALALSELGEDCTSTGFLYENNADIFYERLKKGNVKASFVVSEGAARTNIKIHDNKTGTITELNEKGQHVGEDQLYAMRQSCIELSQSSEYMIFTGSMPPGCPKDFYKTLISEIKCPAVLDADGDALRYGIEAVPKMIKPNVSEFERLLDKKLETKEDIATAAMRFINNGVEYVLVSMGSDGALLITDNEALFAQKIDVDVLSTVGAGDCMVAGFIYGLKNFNNTQKIFASAVAAGTAGVMTKGTGLLQKKNYEDLINKVKISKI